MAFDVNKGQNNSCQINAQGDQYVECTECGATAEIGTVIHADDNVISGVIALGDATANKALYDRYLALAKDVYDQVECELTEGDQLKYKFTFSCTAEKMIFEMRVRSIK